VIASYAGEPTHPDWWLDLKANPRARIEKGRLVLPVVAREADGTEREGLWQEMVATDGADVAPHPRGGARADTGRVSAGASADVVR